VACRDRVRDPHGSRSTLGSECAADPPAHPDFPHERLSLFDHLDGDAAYRSDLMARVADLGWAGDVPSIRFISGVQSMTEEADGRVR
jgi:hypothetical protein